MSGSSRDRHGRVVVIGRRQPVDQRRRLRLGELASRLALCEAILGACRAEVVVPGLAHQRLDVGHLFGRRRGPLLRKAHDPHRIQPPLPPSCPTRAMRDEPDSSAYFSSRLPGNVRDERCAVRAAHVSSPGLRGSMVGVTLPTQTSLTELADAALRACGAPGLDSTGAHEARSPITGATLGGVADTAPVDQAVERATDAFQAVAHDTRTAPRRADPPVRRRCCARTRPTSAGSCRSRSARSRARHSARCRR